MSASSRSPLAGLRVSSPWRLLAALLLPSVAWAVEPAQRLLVLDQDAHAVAGMTDFAGALFSFDLAQPITATPTLHVAADDGAPAWQFVSGLALSPVDGRAFVSDLGLGTGVVADGAIYSYDAIGDTLSTVVAPGHPWLRDPFSVCFLGDGRLVVADWESDPSAFGADDVGGVGHGGVFLVDPSAGTLSLLSDGTNHDVPGLDPALPAFQDPIGVAFDAGSGLIYVADFSGDGDGNGSFNGSLFSVDPADGRVRVVSSSFNFAAPTGVAVRPNGRPLVVDSVPDDSVLFEIDLGESDLTANAIFLSSGTQYSLLEGVTVDRADNVFVVDIGEFDDSPPAPGWIVEPGVYRVDESLRATDPFFDTANARAELAWVDLADTILSPVNLQAVPVPDVSAITPRSFTGATLVRVDGVDLDLSVDFDFGGAVGVSGVALPGGASPGSALEMLLTPLGGPDCSPALIASHAFGGGQTTADAVSLASAPALPFSARGDATRDGIVDGRDLALLGRTFGATVCEVGLFDNDADFNNDDITDGVDLAILMTWFGARP